MRKTLCALVLAGMSLLGNVGCNFIRYDDGTSDMGLRENYDFNEPGRGYFVGIGFEEKF